MLGRRPFVVLLLVAALALALPGGIRTATDGVRAMGSGPDAALAAETWSGPDAALAPTKVAARHDAGTAQRSSGNDPVLLAVLALLAALVALGRGGFVPTASTKVLRPVSWSPVRGRAPPPFKLAVH